MATYEELLTEAGVHLELSGTGARRYQLRSLGVSERDITTALEAEMEPQTTDRAGNEIHVGDRCVIHWGCDIHIVIDDGMHARFGLVTVERQHASGVSKAGTRRSVLANVVEVL